VKLGDTVIVTNWSSPCYNERGIVVAVNPETTAYDYHVKLEHGGAVYGFYTFELEVRA
jgi:hypothetical protein